MSYRTSIYNNNHTQIQKIFSRGGLRDNSVYQGKSEAYFWTFWTPPLDLCMIMIFCQFQCEFNAWHEKKFHILQCMYVYIHITHVQMELNWAPPTKKCIYIHIFSIGRHFYLLINIPCLQELTFRSPEGRQTPLGVQNPWLSGFMVWFKNTFGGTAYLIKSMPFKVTDFWYKVYIDLQHRNKQLDLSSSTCLLWIQPTYFFM